MSFVAPLFLLASLAAALPVVLHLINRQKAVVLPFSTLRFLRVSARRTRRRKYLHDVLLLLLRAAALAFIAVALAGPTVRGLRSMLSGRASTAMVIILDNSASMGSVDQGRPRWEAALDVVENLLEELHDGDSVALLLTCGPRGPESGRLYRNHEVVRGAVAASGLSYERADLPARLQEARKLLAASDAANKEIYAVTDMQAVSWEGLEAKAPGERDEGEQPADETPLVVVSVFGGRAANVALRNPELQAVAPAAGLPMQASAELYGAAPVTQKRHVELYLDGVRQSVSPSIDVEPAAAVRYVFPFAVERAGLHQGEIRLVGDDACSLDDRVFFAVNVDPRVPVAVVKPRSHEIPYLEDTFYLEQALSPGGEADWAIDATTLTPAALAGEPLAPYAVVFCVNLPALDAAAAQRLDDYVQGGGHVFWSCGENVAPDAYNAMDTGVENRLLPVMLRAIREPPLDQPDGWRVAALDGDHPALAGFLEPASLYQSVRVFKHAQFRVAEQAGARVLMRLEDGEPLLVQRSVGTGSVTMWGASLHADWSNFPLKPLFLPLVTRLTLHLAGVEAGQSQAVAGSPLVVSLAGENQAVQIEVTRPGGETVRAETQGEESQVFRYRDTHEVGLYRLRLVGAARPRNLAVGVNADPEECVAATLGPEALRERLGTAPLVFCAGPDDLAAAVSRLRHGDSLRGTFFALVLGLLLGEALVANRLKQAAQAPSSGGNGDKKGSARSGFPPGVRIGAN